MRQRSCSFPRKVGKRALRQAVLLARGRIPPHEVADKSEAVRKAVVSMGVFKRSAALSCYMALRAEVQTASLIEEALAGGKRVAVPKVSREDGELELYWIESTVDGFRPGPYGILEPAAETACKVCVGHIDLFVVPGVAFDPEGWRLGFGKGYYDRLLSRAQPGAQRVGLAFELQIVPHCPRGPHDVPMDYVVTEERTIRSGRST